MMVKSILNRKMLRENTVSILSIIKALALSPVSILNSAPAVREHTYTKANMYKQKWQNGTELRLTGISGLRSEVSKL